ncbi:MAG: hypothetical protein EXQ74_07350 [Thermoleophilia bacterium]|nr:hypothetical protein [Thermoleophilia bacterium]
MAMRRDAGQASVELVATLPVLVVAFVVGLQVIIAAHVWGTARVAARAGARAALVGAPATDAARWVLGADLARHAHVRWVTRNGTEQWIRVRVPVPVLLPLVGAPRITVSAPVTP